MYEESCIDQAMTRPTTVIEDMNGQLMRSNVNLGEAEQHLMEIINFFGLGNDKLSGTSNTQSEQKDNVFMQTKKNINDNANLSERLISLCNEITKAVVSR